MSDQIASRQVMFDRGAAAFVKGHGVDDHHMNPGSPAITEWQNGWHNARRAYERCTQPQAQAVTRSAGSPP